MLEQEGREPDPPRRIKLGVVRVGGEEAAQLARVGVQLDLGVGTSGLKRWNPKAIQRAGWSLLKTKVTMFALAGFFGMLSGLSLLGLSLSYILFVDVLEVDQPFDTHKAGALVFDPEGMLLMGVGDGGGPGDPFGNALNTRSLTTGVRAKR